MEKGFGWRPSLLSIYNCAFEYQDTDKDLEIYLKKHFELYKRYKTSEITSVINKIVRLYDIRDVHKSIYGFKDSSVPMDGSLNIKSCLNILTCVFKVIEVGKDTKSNQKYWLLCDEATIDFINAFAVKVVAPYVNFVYKRDLIYTNN